MKILPEIIKKLRRITPEHWFLLALLILAVGLWALAGMLRPHPLEFYAFSVGDGDAFLIRGPSGRAVMIDAGSRDQVDVGQRVIVPNLLLLGVKKLDAIIITHPDSDHVNGLIAVMQQIPVGMILDPEIPSDSIPYQRVIELAKARNIPRFRVVEGQSLALGNGCSLRFLAPGKKPLVGKDVGTNASGVVAMLEYKQRRMLLMGDVEGEGETALLKRVDDLRAEVLQVAHHGSRLGTTEQLLDRTGASVALISAQAGAKSLHPDPDLLTRLQARGLRILRTDIHGRIRLTTNGEKAWEAETFLEGGTN